MPLSSIRSINFEQVQEPQVRLIRMSRISAVVLIMIATLCGLIASAIMYEMSGDARCINFAGRQRALSERITKNISIALHTLNDSTEVAIRLDNANTSLQLLSQTHTALQYGSEELQLMGLTKNEPWWHSHSAAIDGEFIALAPLYQDYVQEVTTIIAVIRDKQNRQHESISARHQSDVDQRLTRLVRSQEKFFTQMNVVVFALDDDFSRTVRINLFVIAGLVILMVSSIFIVGYVILRPTIHYIDLLFQKIHHQNEELHMQANTIEERAQQIEEQSIEIQSFSEEVTRANQVLLYQNQLLEATISEKNGVLGVVAHDLRTPLTSINMSAYILNEDAISLSVEKIKTMTHGIIESSGRMNSIIDMLLDSQELNDGSIVMSPQRLTLSNIIERIIVENASEAVRKNIAIHNMSENNIPDLFADIRFVESIISNLLSNAIKYSPFDTNVWISVHMKDHTILCEVRDEGPGLSTMDLQKIFGKFQRLSAQPTGGEKSIGLGLSIVKRMAHLLDTDVVCESVHGHGATFIWKIPLESSAVHH